MRIKIFMVLLLLKGLNAYPQFTVTGKIEGLTQPYIYLVWQANWRQNDDPRMDSAAVINGAFTFRGLAAPLPAKAILHLKDYGDEKNVLRFYLENKRLRITGKMGAIAQAQVSGSSVQPEYEKFQAATRDIMTQLEQLGAREDNGDTARERQANALFEKYTQQALAYAGSHPESVLSLDLLNQVAGYREGYTKTDYTRFSELFEKLSPPLRKSSKGKKLAYRLQVLPSTLIGAQAPDFTQPDMNGQPVKLSDFRGRYVLLDFWASWCMPCREESPNVVKAYNAFKDKGFTVLGVSLDTQSSAKMWKDAVIRDQLTWTHVSDLKGGNNEAVLKYGVRGIPNNFLIGPDGVILARGLRGPALQQKLAELLP